MIDPDEAVGMVKAAFPDDVECDPVEFLPRPWLTATWTKYADGSSPRGWSRISFVIALGVLHMEPQMFARYAHHLADSTLSEAPVPPPEDIEEWGRAFNRRRHPPAPQRKLDSFMGGSE